MPDDRLGLAPPVAPAGVFDRLSKTVHDAGLLVVDHIELAALEMQRAADGLVRILIAAIVASVLVVAAWIAVVAGAAIWAMDAGVSLPWALVFAGGVNLVAAVATAVWIRARMPDLMFAATLRQLHTDHETIPDETERHG